MGISGFRRIPESLLLIILGDFLSIADISSFGSVCTEISFAETFNSFWRMLYLSKTSQKLDVNKLVTTRSSRQPRVSLFSYIRLSDERVLSMVLMRVRQLLESSDSIARIRKLHINEISTQYQEFILIDAAYYGRNRCVKYLIQDLKVNINAHPSGPTVAIIAAWQGNVSLIKYILSQTEQRVDLSISSSLRMSSACGGKGPFTALEWSQRKAVACPLDPRYSKCIVLLKNYAARHAQSMES